MNLGNNNNQYQPKALLHMATVCLTILSTSTFAWYVGF